MKSFTFGGPTHHNRVRNRNIVEPMQSYSHSDSHASKGISSPYNCYHENTLKMVNKIIREREQLGDVLMLKGKAVMLHML